MRRKCQRSSRSANTACTGKENQQWDCLYATSQVLEAVNECLSQFASLSAKKFTSVLWLRRPCLRNKMRLTEGLRIFNWILLRQVAFTFSEISPQKNSTPTATSPSLHLSALSFPEYMKADTVELYQHHQPPSITGSSQQGAESVTVSEALLHNYREVRSYWSKLLRHRA